MTSRSGPDDEAVGTTYDFSGFAMVVDVGGGRGSFLALILRRNPTVRGLLFDRDHVLPGTKEYLEGTGVEGRRALVAGDFFASLPAGGDAYLLKPIIHHWDAAARILRRCRQVVASTGRLLVVETVIPPGNDPSYGKLLDLLILVWTGDRERTEAEYRRLLAAAGFERTRVVPTRSSLSVVESAPR